VAESWDRAIAVAGAAVLRSDDGCAMAHTEANIHTTATNTNPYPDSADPYSPGPTAYDPGRYEPCAGVSHTNRDLDAVARNNGIPGDAGRAVDTPLGAAGAGDGSQGRDSDAVEVQTVSRRNAHGPRNALEEMDPGLSSLPGAIEQIRAERDRLRRELAERDAECRAHMEMRYNAERERDEALTQVEYEREQRRLTVMAYDDERSEIKRVLVAFHRQEGDGIMSVRKLAKRLHEASASPAELGEAGYFSPASPPSSWGTDE